MKGGLKKTKPSPSQNIGKNPGHPNRKKRKPRNPSVTPAFTKPDSVLPLNPLSQINSLEYPDYYQELERRQLTQRRHSVIQGCFFRKKNPNPETGNPI